MPSFLLYCHHSSAGPRDHPCWDSGTDLWCCFFLCPRPSLLSTAITGALNRPNHFSAETFRSFSIRSRRLMRPCSDQQGPCDLPSPHLCGFPILGPIPCSSPLVTSLLLDHRHSPAFRPKHLLSPSLMGYLQNSLSSVKPFPTFHHFTTSKDFSAHPT